MTYPFFIYVAMGSHNEIRLACLFALTCCTIYYIFVFPFLLPHFSVAVFSLWRLVGPACNKRLYKNMLWRVTWFKRMICMKHIHNGSLDEYNLESTLKKTSISQLLHYFPLSVKGLLYLENNSLCIIFQTSCLTTLQLPVMDSCLHRWWFLLKDNRSMKFQTLPWLPQQAFFTYQLTRDGLKRACLALGTPTPAGVTWRQRGSFTAHSLCLWKDRLAVSPLRCSHSASYSTYGEYTIGL